MINSLVSPVSLPRQRRLAANESSGAPRRSVEAGRPLLPFPMHADDPRISRNSPHFLRLFIARLLENSAQRWNFGILKQ